MPRVVTTAVRLPAVAGFVEKVTVNDVVVAAVTVPIAPLSKVTVLFEAVGLKLLPVIVTVLALAERLVVVAVTTGDTVATAVAALLNNDVVTTTFSGPAMFGNAANVILSEVVVAAVIMPTAPLLKLTELFVIVELKPKPAIVSVVVPAANAVVLDVTVGTTLATCTALPLLRLLVVTTAVRFPTVVGLVEKVTVSKLAVAVVTVPTTPLLKVTVLFAAVVENPNPLMVIVGEFAPRFAVLLVMIGITLATCTGVPLEMEFVVTTAVRLPAAVGRVDKVTVRVLCVAEVTVPIAPLLKTTRLRDATGSKANPLIVTVLLLAARLTVLLVTTGMTVAT